MVTSTADKAEARPVRRGVYVFVLLGAGVLLGREAGASVGSGMWLSLASGLCALGLLARGRLCACVLGAGVVAFGAGWFGLRLLEVPASSLAGRLPGDYEPPALIHVEGIVRRVLPAREAWPGALQPPAFLRPIDRFEIAVRRRVVGDEREPPSPGWAIEAPSPGWATEDSRGVLRVAAPRFDLGTLRAGDAVRVKGVANDVQGWANPGEPPWALVGRQRGIVGSMRASSIEAVGDASLGALDRMRAAWWRWRDGQQERAERLLLGSPIANRGDWGPLGGAGEAHPGRALLGAIVLGVREGPVESTTDLFVRQGLGHLLAISGFHVAAMAGVTLLAVRLTGDHGRMEALIVAIIVAAYLVILPPRASVLRAGFMVLALLACESTGRRYDRLNLLAWIACALLLYRPLELWNMGFQLTFGITAALMWLYKPVRERLLGPTLLVAPRPVARWWRPWLVEPAVSMLVVSLIAWLVAMPTAAFHTGIVSPLAILATIVVTPLIALCLWLSFVAIGVGVLVEAAGAPVSWFIGQVASGGIGVVRWFDGLPGSTVYVADPGLPLTVGATLVGIHWLRRGHWRDARTWIATVIVLVLAFLRLGPATALPRDTLLRIDALSVGSGSCLLVRSGADAMLWDCGSTNPNVGRRLVPDAVRALGAGPVRTAIITHANYDHYCGLPDVIDRLDVRSVLVGPSVVSRSRSEPGGIAARAVAAIGEKGVQIRVLAAGDAFTLGRARVEIISPAADALYATDNDNSLVALFTVRDSSGRAMRALLTGDIDAPAIEGLRSSIDDLRVHAMEAPHHGSAKEALLELVGRANPVVVLQSSNLERATDERLAPAKRGRRWRATALEGACWVELRADSTIRSGSFSSRPVTDPAAR